MPEEQRRLWDETMRSYPNDWFRAIDLRLVHELVRALAMSDVLAERIAVTTDVAELAVLLRLRDTEARRAAALATKLRLPPQSRSDRHLAGVAARNLRGTARLWEVADPDDPEESFFNPTNTFANNGKRPQ
jgi:hypothetical protein